MFSPGKSFAHAWFSTSGRLAASSWIDRQRWLTVKERCSPCCPSQQESIVQVGAQKYQKILYLINSVIRLVLARFHRIPLFFWGGKNRDIIPLYSIELAILSGLPTKHSLSKCCKAIAVLLVASIMPFWWWYPIGFFLDRFLFDTETLEPCFFFYVIVGTDCK